MIQQRDSPEHPGYVRTQDKAYSTLEMEFCGAHLEGSDDSEIILNPQPDKACRMGDMSVRAGPFEDFKGDGDLVPTMALSGAPFKLPSHIYDRSCGIPGIL